MKNKGITLISLALTVIILGIIGTVTIYSGIEAITSARGKRFASEMEIIRLKCNELLEEGITIEELLARGQDIATLSSNKLSKINNALQQVTNSTNTEGYVYFNSIGLQNLGITSIDREVIINFQEKKIIDLNGVKDATGEYIYTIEWTSNAVLATNEKVQSIALSNTSYNLTIGKTFTLTPIITPSNANNKKVTWSSSDNSIATVESNGVVKAIKGGTVTITATTEDGGKTSTCIVTIDPNPFDKTKVPNLVIETSTIAGVNKERIAPIPAGYTASKIPGEDTISGGLVIYQGNTTVEGTANSADHINAMENRNQFVWIPIDDINDMVMCKKNNIDQGSYEEKGETVITKTCKLVYDTATNEITCKTHKYTTATALTDSTIDITGLAGRVYAINSNTTDTTTPKIYTTNMVFTEASKDAQKFTKDMDNREPDIVTSYDKDDEISGKTYMADAGITDKKAETLKAQLNNDFIAMAKSVAKYGGFYISRFELSYENSKVISKKNKAVLSAFTFASGNYLQGDRWYGLYNKTRNETEKEESVNSHMIWGCQYDQVIKFLGKEKGEKGHVYQTTSQQKTGYTDDQDILNNIYDLEGNNWELTALGKATSDRIYRGGYNSGAKIGSFYPASNYGSFATSHYRQLLYYYALYALYNIMFAIKLYRQYKHFWDGRLCEN